MKDTRYDIDITREGTLADYKNGFLIPFEYHSEENSKTQAIKEAKHLLTCGKFAGVRVVKVTGLIEENPAPTDIFIQFKI